MSVDMKSFIEVQFPVSKLSKESYKERKGVQSQTLTGLGKWWGRKPLILVRAAILGLLMPATDDPKKDRKIFLKLLTMDEEGLWRRKTKSIPQKIIYNHLTPREKQIWFSQESNEENPKLKKGLRTAARQELQHTIFMRLSYDEKLNYCDRPEQIDGPSVAAWESINAHLSTKAKNFPDLVKELGDRQMGHVPSVGDAFCGGGSVPFEASRLGCKAYGSDLNPVAALLTWASLQIIGGGQEVSEQVHQAQKEIYEAVDRQISELGIENNEKGWRADAFLYCTEAICPECMWKIPLAPSWLIGPTSRCIANLKPNESQKSYDILVESGVSDIDMERARNDGTLNDSVLRCPHCHKSNPISLIRGDRNFKDGKEYGLRLWEKTDLVPRSDDVFQERLYCIRWVEKYCDKEGNEQTRRFYRAPDKNDIEREFLILKLLREQFEKWQEKGYIPSNRIEPGEETTRLLHERGWTYWHHLFTPRQLLLHGLFSQTIDHNNHKMNEVQRVACLLGIGRCSDWDSKLCRWGVGAARESIAQTFYNQALNTLFTFAGKGLKLLDNAWFGSYPFNNTDERFEVIPCDARSINVSCDYWITDPPYADAINYHELSEFFLAWYEKHVRNLFPAWYVDSKRALAVKGSDESFLKSMVDCYRNLAQHMPENGAQIVMFTHQDVSVWADLALILWASGLRVTAAWCIVTETDSALKDGNYVQGTVFLILRKQTSGLTAFLDEIYPQVEIEVKAQLESMLKLEDREDTNFGDTDYQLAAYAAALRVLTQYKKIEDIDVMYELTKPQRSEDDNPIEIIINEAVKIACDYLIPSGFDAFVWKALTAEERFYLRGLDIESRGEYRSGAYQELARGFGINEYKPMIASGKANQTRLKTASEFSSRQIGDSGFGNSLIRHALFAVREVVRTEQTEAGRNWFRNELKESYWNHRKTLIVILKYLGNLGFTNMAHWKDDAKAAQLLAVAVENDHI
jgi:putative DNA methylase